jgi:hypothetical protein
MVRRPVQFGGYMFSVLSSLRAAQLVQGSIPRVVVGTHKLITTAQMEVAEEKVVQSAPETGSRVVPLPAPIEEAFASSDAARSAN